MKQTKAKIKDKKIFSDQSFTLTLESEHIARTALPGQFVMAKPEADGFMLRRPFSIARTDKNDFTLLIKIVGKGTELMSRFEKGDLLDVIGPLGKGYEIQDHNFLPVFVAGGTGAASLLFLSQCFMLPPLAKEARGIWEKPKKSLAVAAATVALQVKRLRVKPVLFLGAKTKDELFFVDDFRRDGFDVKKVTDDGSCGEKGLVSCIFSDWISKRKFDLEPVVFSCGPEPMLKHIAEITKSRKIKCYISLEEKMACGAGVCLGCAVKVKTKAGFEYKKACADGPVFDAQDIVWN